MGNFLSQILALVALLSFVYIQGAVYALKTPTGRAAPVSTREFEAIKDVEVIRSENGNTIKMGELWSTKDSVFASEDRAVVILFRSFG